MIRTSRRPDGTLWAAAVVVVAAIEVEIEVSLGPWEGPPPDRRGLAGAPVVVTPDPAARTVATSAATHAGADARALDLAGEPFPGARLLRERAEVVVADGGADLLRVARALGGRPILALPEDLSALPATLADLEVDVHVAVPSLEGAAREQLRTALARAGLPGGHHVVEVDPRPALAVAGSISATGAATAASAAGLLAGRLAVRSRRWRPEDL